MPTSTKRMRFTITDPAPSGGSYPSWIDSIPLFTWAPIALNTMSNVVPANTGFYGNGPDYIPAAWNGAAFASGYGTMGGLIVWGGGHKNYYGTEVYAFGMETQLWVRLSDPYPNAGSPGPGGNGVWPASGTQVNGSPGVIHTYNTVLYNPVNNSFYTHQTQSDDGGPTKPRQVCQFPLSGANQYVWQIKALGSAGMASGGWSAYDSNRNLHYYRGGTSASASPRTFSYNPVTDVITEINTSGGANISQTYSSAAYSPTQDIVLVMNGATQALYTLNPASLVTAPVAQTEVNAPAKANQNALEWSPALGKFLYYRTGADVYSITRSGTTCTWANIKSASNTTVPENDFNANGVFSKFRVANYGTREVCVVYKRISGTGQVYAFRTL
jgi:hypothetical protein